MITVIRTRMFTTERSLVMHLEIIKYASIQNINLISYLGIDSFVGHSSRFNNLFVE